ncbi:hypothetical protein ACTQ2R_05850 [Hallella faecis]|uniref:hypothetical protein n=1 Tax=Hallella faecis TaxID=2841596 RepID=UPI003F8EDEE0
MMVVCPIFLYALTLLLIALYSRNMGRPTMISEIYYGTGRSLLLPCLLVSLALSFLPVMLDLGGQQWLAFLTCMGLAFVGAAPAYLREGEHSVHKGAAIMSALAGTLWCMTMEPCVVAVAAIMAIIATLTDRRCWLFWCEVCAMSSVAATVVLKTLGA